MALRPTRQQRISNVGLSMVNSLTTMCENWRGILTDGLDVKNEPGLPPLKTTGQEVIDALGENAAIVQNIIAYVLDGKSNKIVKAVKSSRRK